MPAPADCFLHLLSPVEPWNMQEESARAKLQAEMERLRKQAAERAAKKAAEQRAAAAAAQAAAAVEQGGCELAAGAQQAAAGSAAGAQPDVLSEEMKERLTRTLKVSWSRKVRSLGYLCCCERACSCAMQALPGHTCR